MAAQGVKISQQGTGGDCVYSKENALPQSSQRHARSPVAHWPVLFAACGDRACSPSLPCRVGLLVFGLHTCQPVSDAAGREGFQDAAEVGKEGLQENQDAAAAGKEGLQDVAAAGKEGLQDIAVGLGVGLCIGGWFLSAALLLSAVIITPISVGSLPTVLRVAAVGGVGVMVASPAMMLFWVWQKAMVLLRRRAQERKTAPHTTDPPEVAHQKSPPSPLPKATLRPSQHPQHPRTVQHLRTTG
jgi:hypothetical protein